MTSSLKRSVHLSVTIVCIVQWENIENDSTLPYWGPAHKTPSPKFLVNDMLVNITIPIPNNNNNTYQYKRNYDVMAIYYVYS